MIPIPGCASNSFRFLHNYKKVHCQRAWGFTWERNCRVCCEVSEAFEGFTQTPCEIHNPQKAFVVLHHRHLADTFIQNPKIGRGWDLYTASKQAWAVGTVRCVKEEGIKNWPEKIWGYGYLGETFCFLWWTYASVSKAASHHYLASESHPCSITKLKTSDVLNTVERNSNLHWVVSPTYHTPVIPPSHHLMLSGCRWFLPGSNMWLGVMVLYRIPALVCRNKFSAIIRSCTNEFN